MSKALTPAMLREVADISPSYAHMILSGARDPSRPLAILFFRKLGWRHRIIADLTEEQISALEEIEPWMPREKAAAEPQDRAA